MAGGRVAEGQSGHLAWPDRDLTGQWRRKEILIVGGGAMGAAPGRVREGGTPPAQLGGMGERRELPHRGLGLRPRSQRFLRLKNSKNYTKTRRPCKRPRPLLHIYMYKYVY